MRVTGPADLARVEYYIDNTKIGEVTKSPYSLQFNTDNYPLGLHELYAVGYSTGGQQYRSNSVSANFVPKQSSMKIILPILGVVLAVILLSTLAPLIARRGKRLNIPLGAERKLWSRWWRNLSELSPAICIAIVQCTHWIFQAGSLPFLRKVELSASRDYWPFTRG